MPPIFSEGVLYSPIGHLVAVFRLLPNPHRVGHLAAVSPGTLTHCTVHIWLLGASTVVAITGTPYVLATDVHPTDKKSIGTSPQGRVYTQKGAITPLPPPRDSDIMIRLAYCTATLHGSCVQCWRLLVRVIVTCISAPFAGEEGT